jgi:hypothetical protein
VHFYLHIRGSIALTDMVGMNLPDAEAAASVGRQMLATYHARQSVDASLAYVEITDGEGRPLQTIGAAPNKADGTVNSHRGHSPEPSNASMRSGGRKEWAVRNL